MMPPVPEPVPTRKRVELEAKLAALPRELDLWRDLSAAGRPFEKHQSQIERLSAQVRGLHDEVKVDFGKLATTDALLAQARTIELRLLAVHSVWDYFRSKFVLRSHEPFGSVLKAADAFAWACYEPVQRAHAGSLAPRREPPLVSLQSQWTPTALPRGRAYEVARSPGGWTDSAPFARVIESLPIPIIGLPWHALDHLPHVALLAHEVGHVVAQDFDLQSKVDRALADLTLGEPRHRSAWQAWSNEIMADVFACYAAGPAFPWALIDALAAPVDRVSGENKKDEWGEYPTSTLRVRMNAETLRQLDFAKDAEDMEAEWRRTYPTHKMAVFDPDLPTVVKAIRGAGVLPAELAFAQVAPKSREAFDYLRQGLSLEGDDRPLEPRALVAAAGQLYRAAPGALHQEHWQAVRTRIITGRAPGTLAGQDPGVTRPNAELDRAAGRSLARQFFDSLGD
jgi:hypothetical protein